VSVVETLLHLFSLENSYTVKHINLFYKGLKSPCLVKY